MTRLLSRRNFIKALSAVGLALPGGLAGFPPGLSLASEDNVQNPATGRVPLWRRLSEEEIATAILNELANRRAMAALWENLTNEGYVPQRANAMGVTAMSRDLMIVPFVGPGGSEAKLTFGSGAPLGPVAAKVVSRKSGSLTMISRSVRPDGAVIDSAQATLEGTQLTVTDLSNLSTKSIELSSPNFLQLTQQLMVPTSSPCEECREAVDNLYSIGCAFVGVFVCLLCGALVHPIAIAACVVACAIGWNTICDIGAGNAKRIICEDEMGLGHCAPSGCPDLTGSQGAPCEACGEPGRTIYQVFCIDGRPYWMYSCMVCKPEYSCYRTLAADYCDGTCSGGCQYGCPSCP